MMKNSLHFPGYQGLTPRGEKLHARVYPLTSAGQQRLLSVLAPGEHEMFLDLLARVIEGNRSLARPGTIPVLWFGMDFQGAASTEAAALNSRQQYLTTLAEQRRCGEPAEPPPAPSARAIRIRLSQWPQTAEAGALVG